MPPPQPGDALPDVTLFEGTPGNKIKLRDLFAGKKGVILAVPGAFTPGCSKTHLPGYVRDYDKFKAAGADVIVCVATNDPFVQSAWGEVQGATGKIHMLSDMNLELTNAWDVAMDALGGKRSKRYSCVIVDNTIKAFNLENPGEMVCSLSDPTLEHLKAA